MIDMIDDPSAARAAADLSRSDFQCGCVSGRWRIISYAFPTLEFAVTATEPDGTASEYAFRAVLDGYPANAPHVRIWDHAANTPLPLERRPKLPPRYSNTFQQWEKDTVYRPWERFTGPHNGNAAAFPFLAWRPERRLVFIFEDLHGILHKNAVAHRLRASA